MKTTIERLEMFESEFMKNADAHDSRYMQGLHEGLRIAIDILKTETEKDEDVSRNNK